LDSRYDCIFRSVDRVRPVLRSREVGSLRARISEVRSQLEENEMSWESIIMLVISALTMVYLIYALLRPEKF